jgi:3-deoxy-D-manno-octulosonic-acid transferase
VTILADALYGFTLLPHYAWHRFFTGKYGAAVPEKLGAIPVRSGAEKCLWLHAVSVGETLAARPLVKAFEKAYPDWNIVITTTTATGREVACKNFGAERVLYFPLDFSLTVKKFFDCLRPTLVVLMELEVWPNFLAEAKRRGVPVAVANVRITDRSLKRFRFFGSPARNMLNQVSLWLSQSEDYAAKVKSLGVPEEKVHVVGSLKYEMIPTDPDPALVQEWRRLFGVRENDRLLVAGSTHPSEEKVVLEAFAKLLKSGFENLKLVLAPRHPDRLEEVFSLAKTFGEVARRSGLSEATPASAPLILLDTMGELGQVYAAADAVFVGGTLIDHGGQNMLEPCGLGKPTVIGNSYYNFSEAVDILKNADGIRFIATAEELPEALGEIFSNAAGAKKMGVRARESLLKMKGATDKTLRLIAGLTA